MKKILAIVVALSLCGLMWMVTGGTQRNVIVGETLDLSKPYPVAPNFQLNDLHGDVVELSSYRNSVVVLHFWATWCPPCREELPSLNRLQQLFSTEDVVLLAVNVEADGPTIVPNFMQKNALNFKVLFDIDGAVRAQYGVAKYPETFILDRNGIVVNKVTGATDWTHPQAVAYLKGLLD